MPDDVESDTSTRSATPAVDAPATARPTISGLTTDPATSLPGSAMDPTTAPGLSTDPAIRALQRLLNPRLAPAPTFHGFDHEDPEVFIGRAKRHLENLRLTQDLWVETAQTYLKGDAGKWYGQYQALSLEWTQFTERLIARFSSPTLIGRLTSKLYGTPQGGREPADVFLLKKIQLLRRLFPAAEDVNFIPIFAGLLRPNTRRIVRIAQPTTFESLLEQASQLEEDEAAARPPTQRNAPAVRNEKNNAPASPSSNQANARKPPKCWHCPNAFHFHRDCPTLAEQHRSGNSGNERGATANATAAARH